MKSELTVADLNVATVKAAETEMDVPGSGSGLLTSCVCCVPFDNNSPEVWWMTSIRFDVESRLSSGTRTQPNRPER